MSITSRKKWRQYCRCAIHMYETPPWASQGCCSHCACIVPHVQCTCLHPAFLYANHVCFQVVDFQRQDFTLKGLADVSWSLATAHHWTPKLADLAAEVVVLGGLKEIRANYHFTGLLWSFAILNFDPPNLLNEVPPPQRGSLGSHVQWLCCILCSTVCELSFCEQQLELAVILLGLEPH